MALRNSQYDMIVRAYNQKQFKNKHDLDKRIEEVYKCIPRIREIDQEISSISVHRAKQLLNGTSSALQDLKKELADLGEEKTILLKRAGFPDNYMEMQYHCPDCQDTGYQNNRKCHCFKQSEIDMLYTQSNIRNILQRENFHTFSLQFYDNKVINPITGKTSLANIKDIVRTCHQFIEDFGSTFENLLFYGDIGVGKTFLSNCIAKELLDRSYSVIYQTAIQFFELFSKYTFEDNENSSETSDMLQYILECDLLIIDDLGTELTNTFTNSKFFYCLNERFIRRKSTIISTNLTLDMISQTYSERIFSRISSNYKLLKFYGDDIRLKKKLLANRP